MIIKLLRFKYVLNIDAEKKKKKKNSGGFICAVIRADKNP